MEVKRKTSTFSRLALRSALLALGVLAALSCGSSQSGGKGDGVVKWQTWQTESWKRAQDQKKPILLYLTAPWCRQCAEMELHTFTRPEIARTINEATIPIKINSEELPNVYDRYTLGGLPSCIFLTPAGLPFGGATNIPTDTFRVLMDRVLDAWQSTPAVVEIQATRLDSLFRASLTNLRFRRPNEQVLREAETAIYAQYDSVYGGFGNQPKTPQPDLNLFLYNATGPSGEPLFRGEVTQTFAAQAKLIDSIWGGICRTAMFADWSGVGFEKLLESEARLAQNYIELFQVTHDEKYRVGAETILRHLEQSLRTERNWGWYSSQAGYLVRDGEVYDLQRYLQLSDTERRAYGVPEIDRNIYTGENAAAVSAYLAAGRILGRRDLIEYALRSLDSLGQLSANANGLFHHAPLQPGRGELGLVGDQVAMLTALLDAYETVGDRKYLHGAELTARTTFAALRDQAAGGLNMEPIVKEAFGRMRTPVKSYEIVSRAVAAYTRLFYLTANEEYRQPTERIAGYLLSVTMSDNDLRKVLLANAYLWLTRYPVKLVLVGPRGAAYDSLLASIWKQHRPRLVVGHLGDGTNEVSYGKLKIGAATGAQIYACGDDTVSAPITSPDSLNVRLEDFLLAIQRLVKVEN